MSQVETTKRGRKGEAKVRWSREEDDIIRTHYAKLGPKRVAAMLPGRTLASVTARGMKLGLSHGGHPPTNSLHADAVGEMVKAGIPTRVIAETLNLSFRSLEQYIYLHGLRAERKLLEVDLAREIAEKYRETK